MKNLNIGSTLAVAFALIGCTNSDQISATALPAPVVSINDVPANLKGASTVKVNFTNAVVDQKQIVSAQFLFAADGTNFTPVATLSPTDTSYQWTIPHVDLTNAKIKIIAKDNRGFSSEKTSNAFNILSTAPLITLTSNSAFSNDANVVNFGGTCKPGAAITFFSGLTPTTTDDVKAHYAKLSAPTCSAQGTWYFPDYESIINTTFSYSLQQSDIVGNSTQIFFTWTRNCTGNCGLAATSPTPAATPTATPAVVCNPLDPKNQTDPTLGIQSSLYYIPTFVVGGAYPVTTCDEFVSKGANANVDVFLSDLNIPPENFSAGFKTQTGSFLTKPDGTELVEWFSLRGSSQLQLAPGQAEGDYQIGTMSDDGIVVQLQNDDGTWSTVIDHQLAHSAVFDCNANTIHMTQGKKVAMKFSYYQGPRVRLSLMMLWRKVDSTTPHETMCAVDHGDDYYFNGNVTPSAPLAPYVALQARGWAPLVSQNFLLTSGTNKCVTSK